MSEFTREPEDGSSQEHPLDPDNPTWREEVPSGHAEPEHDDGRDTHPGNQ